MSFVINPYLFTSFAPTDLPELELWLDANEGVIKTLADPGIPATNTEETVGALVDGFPTGLGIFGDNPNGVRGRAGTLNGKAQYSGLYWSLGNEPHWSTPRWVLEHGHSDYDNSTTTHYFGFGDTQYPWQASWVTANGAYEIGSGGSSPNNNHTYGTVTMNEFDDGIPPTPAVEAANDELVQQWNNKVSGKPNLSQGTESRRPVFKSDVFGRKAVYFNGDALSSAGFSTFAREYSYYLVATSLEGSISASIHVAIRLGTSTFAGQIRGAFGANAQYLGANNGTSRVSSINSGANSGAVWSARFNIDIGGSEVTVGKNLTSELLSAIGTNSANSGTIVIGAVNTSGSTAPITSNFSEVLVYRALHDEATANQVINYLIQKWNIDPEG